MAAILKRMLAGFPGDVTRKTESIVESGVMAESVKYGTPVMLDSSGKFALAKDEEDAIYGFMVRPYPTQAALAEKGGVNDCLRSGYMTVTLANGTAKKGNPVYVRIASATNKEVGDIEAAPSSVFVDGENGTTSVADNILIPNCIFMGEADSGGSVEISFNV